MNNNFVRCMREQKEKYGKEAGVVSLVEGTSKLVGLYSRSGSGTHLSKKAKKELDEAGLLVYVGLELLMEELE